MHSNCTENCSVYITADTRDHFAFCWIIINNYWYTDKSVNTSHVVLRRTLHSPATSYIQPLATSPMLTDLSVCGLLCIFNMCLRQNSLHNMQGHFLCSISFAAIAYQYSLAPLDGLLQQRPSFIAHFVLYPNNTIIVPGSHSAVYAKKKLTCSRCQ